MKLHLQIEKGKDATGKVKRVMWVQLRTEIEGMRQIDAVAELGDDSALGREITRLTADLLADKKKSLQEQKEKIKKSKKLKEKKQ